MRRTRLFCTTAILLLGAQSAGATLIVNLIHIGFPSTSRKADVIREGCWVPITIDMTLEGEAEFYGYVRVGQFDDDGDLCIDRTDVLLRADGSANQRYYLYVPANPSAQQRSYAIEVFDRDGEAVEFIGNDQPTMRLEALQPPDVIQGDDLYILSVSTRPLGRLADLYQRFDERPFDRPIVVSHIGPGGLPDHWIGLEAVDVLVWDDVRLETVSASQINAVVQWVEHGGTLLMAAGQSAAETAQVAAINAILPVNVEGVSTTNELSKVGSVLFGTPTGRSENGYSEPVFVRQKTVANCTAREGAQTLLHEEAVPTDLVTRHRVGRGAVVFCAMTLHELFEESALDSADAENFFRRTLLLQVDQQAQDGYPTESVALFNHVADVVGFATSGGRYLILAILFTIAYGLIATGGVWVFLAARGLRHHNWTGFGLVAAAATVLSVITVEAVQGVRVKVHQVSVIDADADQPYGYGTVLLGVKTPGDTRMNLWLPSDANEQTLPVASPCSLKPLSEPTVAAQTAFADSIEYLAGPASAELLEVRIRATLKRFHGKWEGPLGGRAGGTLRYDRGRKRLTDDSFVFNGLSSPLTDCYLIYCPQSSFGGEGKAPLLSNRSRFIQTYLLGDIAPDGQHVPVVDRFLMAAAASGQPNPVADREAEIAKSIQEHSLFNEHANWKRDFQGVMGFTLEKHTYTLGDERNALLILSTIGEFEGATHMTQTYVGNRKSLSRSRLRELDLREQLQPDVAYLIGFTQNDAGPIRLAAAYGDDAYEVLRPDPERSWVMYRIRIPVETRGASGGRSNEPSDDETPAPNVEDENTP